MKVKKYEKCSEELRDGTIHSKYFTRFRSQTTGKIIDYVEQLQETYRGKFDNDEILDASWYQMVSTSKHGGGIQVNQYSYLVG